MLIPKVIMQIKYNCSRIVYIESLSGTLNSKQLKWQIVQQVAKKDYGT
jgi:hypothetical protein